MNKGKTRRATEWMVVRTPTTRLGRDYLGGSYGNLTRILPGLHTPHPDSVTVGGVLSDWRKSSLAEMRGRLIADEEWMAERFRHAGLLMRECIEVDPERRGGIPVVRGTNFTVAQLLQELAEGKNIADIARR